MADNEHNPDPNENAARIVGESGAQDELPADLESAWLEWSAKIQKVDERAMTLLRGASRRGMNLNVKLQDDQAVALVDIYGGSCLVVE